MTDDEALDAVAKDAATEIYGLKPYQRTSGMSMIFDKDRAGASGLSLSDWLKRHWQRFPWTFPRRAVDAKKAEVPDAGR
jgi:hypothetical protein